MCVCVRACVLSFSVVSTLCNPMDYSLPGFSSPWNSLGKNTGVGCHFPPPGDLPHQELNLRLLCLLHWEADWDLLPLTPAGKPLLST